MTKPDPQCEPPRELMREDLFVREILALRAKYIRFQKETKNMLIITLYENMAEGLEEAVRRGGYGGLLK